MLKVMYKNMMALFVNQKRCSVGKHVSLCHYHIADTCCLEFPQRSHSGLLPTVCDNEAFQSTFAEAIAGLLKIDTAI